MTLNLPQFEIHEVSFCAGPGSCWDARHKNRSRANLACSKGSREPTRFLGAMPDRVLLPRLHNFRLATAASLSMFPCGWIPMSETVLGLPALVLFRGMAEGATQLVWTSSNVFTCIQSC